MNADQILQRIQAQRDSFRKVASNFRADQNPAKAEIAAAAAETLDFMLRDIAQADRNPGEGEA